MSKRLEIEPNKRWGRLTYIKDLPNGYRRMVECKCDCGNLKSTALYLLTSNQTTSCGCLHKEIIGNLNKTHGDSKSVEYKCWSGILRRCDNPKNKWYKDYGGRGIDYDPRYKDYLVFKQDLINTIGLRPGFEYSLDRINNDKGYWNNNWKWSTQTEQNFNRRSNKKKYKHGM